MQSRTHVFISGRVQGVAFRRYVLGQAGSLGLSGWVRNTEDGKVEAVFEGEKSQVEKMLGLCKAGPPRARVAGLEMRAEPYTGGFAGFKIVR